ncbi:MAG: hypothetical protein ACREUN_15275, partial [Burkholderiales bacterium]
MSFLLRKLASGRIWKRILHERGTEPLHLNALSLLVALFGGFRARVAWDLVVRHHHAYGMLRCADLARGLGVREVAVVELGVAGGAGLLNICELAEHVRAQTGVSFRIAGFDTGRGMPPPASYKDHPELYRQGDFPMNQDALAARLPGSAGLFIGDVAVTVPRFLEQLSPDCPLGFLSLDLDYYSSSKAALRLLTGPPEHYLPRVGIYVDDLEDEYHNSYCGELLALREFNLEQELRKIEPYR